MRRRIWAFLVAALVLIVLGTAAQSYRVQEAWSTAAGQAMATAPVAIPLGDRLQWMAHDLGSLLDSYGALSALTLLIALLIAGVVTRWSGHRTLVFALAGASGMLVLFTVLKAVLGTVGVFGARGVTGHVAQAAAGLLAAWLFARLTAPRPSATPDQGS
jgi:hypothetical protein